MTLGVAERGLLDTSVFIAAESGRPLRTESIPDEGAISIVTKAELRAGILAAADVETRDRRLKTLELAARIAVFPIDEEVAQVWAQMRAYLGAASRRINSNDMWIAATAAAHRMPVVTQDGDFVALSGVGGLALIEV
jgi:predicted nucleic acid-binding protein